MPSQVTIYGIRNCDTMKKARAWLDHENVAYRFHDYKKAGIDRDRLAEWLRTVDWPVLLNRAGTTFRKLPDAEKSDLDADRAVDLMVAYPSMIKRPVLDIDGGIIVGFDPEKYQRAFDPSPT